MAGLTLHFQYLHKVESALLWMRERAGGKHKNKRNFRNTFETRGAGAASSKHGMPAALTKWRGSCGGPKRCKRSFPEEGFPAAYHPRCNRKPLTSLSQASTRQRPNANALPRRCSPHHHGALGPIAPAHSLPIGSIPNQPSPWGMSDPHVLLPSCNSKYSAGDSGKCEKTCTWERCIGHCEGVPQGGAGEEGWGPRQE